LTSALLLSLNGRETCGRVQWLGQETGHNSG